MGHIGSKTPLHPALSCACLSITYYHCQLTTDKTFTKQILQIISKQQKAKKKKRRLCVIKSEARKTNQCLSRLQMNSVYQMLAHCNVQKYQLMLLQQPHVPLSRVLQQVYLQRSHKTPHQQHQQQQQQLQQQQQQQRTMGQRTMGQRTQPYHRKTRLGVVKMRNIKVHVWLDGVACDRSF